MNFAQESQIDIIARKINMDPIALKVKNYRREGEMDPVLNERILSNGLEECMEKGSRSCGWEEKRLRQPKNGPIKRGIGLSIMLHGTGAARSSRAGHERDFRDPSQADRRAGVSQRRAGREDRRP